MTTRPRSQPLASSGADYCDGLTVFLQDGLSARDVRVCGNGERHRRVMTSATETLAIGFRRPMSTYNSKRFLFEISGEICLSVSVSLLQSNLLKCT